MRPAEEAFIPRDTYQSLEEFWNFFWGVDLAFLLIIKKYLHVIENEELKYPCMFLTNPDPKLLTSNDRGSFF